MHYVIIGGSIAGVSAAKSIRNTDQDSDLTLISGEKPVPYYRPMIPLLIEKDDINISFEEDLISELNITAVYNRADGIELNAKEVVLASGKRIGFDKLLIATGSSPFIPDIPGLKGTGVFTLRTMEDAFKIKAYAPGKKDAVILGCGLVGIKAATALKHLGFRITIVERLPQILYQRLDRRGAHILSSVMQKKAITVLTDTTIAEVMQKDGAVHAVRLSSGKTVKADIVVIATGAKPSVDFLKNSGIPINEGILINEQLQAGSPDVYAAGDVVEYVDVLTNTPAVSALWTHAEEMGRLAGKNMAGSTIAYPGFVSVMNATEIFGLPIISVGLIEPDEKEYEVIVEDSIDSYRKLVFKGDTLVGVVFIGDIANAGIYANLIKNRTSIGRLKEEAIKGNLRYIHFLQSPPKQAFTV